MKVICIDDKWETSPGYEPADSNPVFGEICTVSNICKQDGDDYYSLVGYGVGLYETCAFAPLSSIDETQMTRENIQELTSIS